MFRKLLHIVVALVILLAMIAPVVASEGQTGGEGDINPLALSAWKSDLAIWTAVVFVLLAMVLGKFAWRPIADGLDKRERNIADQIAGAEAANQKAKDLLAEYEAKLADAQDQVKVIIDQGRRSAEQAGRVLVEKAKEDATVEYDRAAKQIETAKNAAVKELAAQSAAMAVDLAGKIVGASIKSSDHARLIDQAVAGFTQQPGNVSRN